MLKQSGIYEIVNTVNGKRYIGSATRLRKRFASHRCYLRKGMHHSQPLQKAWDKYGEAAFIFAPILICAPAELLFYEARCLAVLTPEYNVATAVDNAMRGRKHSADTRAKIGAAQKGKIVSAETRGRISRAGVGRVCSVETRLRRGRSLLGNTNAAGSKGRTGAKASDALRAKLAAAHKGVPLSDAHRAAMSAAQKRRWAKSRGEA